MKHTGKIKNFMALVKFSHTIFAMPFALIGYSLAIKLENKTHNWILFLYIILCMIFARNAAMAFNRYIDRNIDIKNPRTAIREIPRGIIKPSSALQFVIANTILFILTTFFINNLVFLLSPIALLIILGYSYTKKFTSLCHLILGLGLSLAPIGAYLAVTASFAMQPVLLSIIVLTWVSGFDIIYALQDIEFDKHEKLFSVPVKYGKNNALIISAILHLIATCLIIYVGYILKSGYYYWIGATAFIGLLIWQHIIITAKNQSRINLAFFTLNGIASIIYAVFTILDIFICMN